MSSFEPILARNPRGSKGSALTAHQIADDAANDTPGRGVPGLRLREVMRDRFAAEEHVPDTADPLDVELHRRSDDADMAGMDQEPLAGLQVLGHDLPGQVKPDHARPGDPLQDEALPAEKGGSEAPFFNALK